MTTLEQAPTERLRVRAHVARAPMQQQSGMGPNLRHRTAFRLAVALMAAAAAVPALATEHVTLTNGFDMVCDHQERVGDRVRVYMAADSPGFVEFGVGDIASIEPGPVPAVVAKAPVPVEPVLTQSELHEMLTKAGFQHHLDVDLLASVVHAESGGNAHAVSRTGARGLMQLMPGTAKELGVHDSFHAEENINGGTAYLDSLLVKYHDKLALALAAYNAGPAAVDRWHGVPPYRETRAYVARVIREFNRAALARRRTAEPMQLAALKHDPTHTPMSSHHATLAALATGNPSGGRSATAPSAKKQRAATQLAMADHPR